jgi:hypothetical protein
VSDDAKSVPERAAELFVYAPVGVAMYLRDTVPTFLGLFVNRGRNEVKRYGKDARKQVDQAKSMGQFAVTYGGPRLRRKLEDGVTAARKSAETVLSNLGSADGAPAINGYDGTAPAARPDAGRPAPKVAAAAQPAPVVPAASPPSSEGELVIPDYDELSASQVVERLEGLRRDELEAVRAYEAANRARRTILFKIDQLA